MRLLAHKITLYTRVIYRGALGKEGDSSWSNKSASSSLDRIHRRFARPGLGRAMVELQVEPHCRLVLTTFFLLDFPFPCFPRSLMLIALVLGLLSSSSNLHMSRFTPYKSITCDSLSSSSLH